jgi:hypothetical protein
MPGPRFWGREAAGEFGVGREGAFERLQIISEEFLSPLLQNIGLLRSCHITNEPRFLIRFPGEV